MLKNAILLVVILASLFFAIPLVLPSHFKVEVQSQVSRHPVFIFTEIRDFQNWVHWSPWLEIEPTATYTYNGTPGDTGFTMGWFGEKIGEGQIRLVQILEPLRLESELQFEPTLVNTAKDIWIFDSMNKESDLSTKLRWIRSGELSYPLGRYYGFALESRLRSQMSRGLERMKLYLESSAPLEE